MNHVRRGRGKAEGPGADGRPLFVSPRRGVRGRALLRRWVTGGQGMGDAPSGKSGRANSARPGDQTRYRAHTHQMTQWLTNIPVSQQVPSRVARTWPARTPMHRVVDGAACRWRRRGCTRREVERGTQRCCSGKTAAAAAPYGTPSSGMQHGGTTRPATASRISTTAPRSAMQHRVESGVLMSYSREDVIHFIMHLEPR